MKEEGEIRTLNGSSGQVAPNYRSDISPGYIPSPYFPPPGFRFETKTEKGLKFLNWGLWINVVASIFIIIAIMYLISNGTGMLSALALLVFLGGGGILSFVFFILWILGLIFMNSGKYEYGPIHSQKVIIALIFFILAIVSYISGYVFILFYIFSGNPLSNFGSNISMMYIIQIISYFFTNLFTSLMWVFLILQLAQQRIKYLLWIFFMINITIFLIASVITITGIVWGPYIQSYIGGFGIFGNILLIYCYWKTYNRVRNREIMPIIPPLMPPPLYPPNYPPYFPPKYEPKLKTGPYNQPPK